MKARVILEMVFDIGEGDPDFSKRLQEAWYVDLKDNVDGYLSTHADLQAHRWAASELDKQTEIQTIAHEMRDRGRHGNAPVKEAEILAWVHRLLAP